MKVYSTQWQYNVQIGKFEVNDTKKIFLYLQVFSRNLLYSFCSLVFFAFFLKKKNKNQIFFKIEDVNKK